MLRRSDGSSCLPQATLDATARTRIVSVNSRNRRNFSSTTPNDYVVVLPVKITKVRAIRLITTEFTNSRYLIDSTNNKIDFTSAVVLAGTYVATLTSGHYNASDLQTELDYQLNAALGVGPGVAFTVTYEPSTTRFTFTRVDGGTFRFLGATGSNISKMPYEQLGLLPVDGTLATTFTCPNAANLQGDDYTLMKLRDLGRMDGTEGIGEVFAKLIWPVPSRAQVNNAFASVPLEFRDQPMERLTELGISFCRPNGAVCDWQGIEHSFTLEIVSDS
jgi:hypothetical protein